MDYREQIKRYQPRCEQEKRDKAMMLELMESCGQRLLWRDCRAVHFTSSGFILNQDLDKCLFAYHRIYDAWGWTGGHADGNGDLLQVAVKEAQEETGLVQVDPLSFEIASLDILPVHGHWKNGSYVSPHLHLCAAYLLIADEDQPIRPKKDENTAVKWIYLYQIEQYSREQHMLPIYRKLTGRIRENGIGMDR